MKPKQLTDPKLTFSLYGMGPDIFAQGGEEWPQTDIQLVFHDDTMAADFAHQLHDDGFSLGEAIGLAEIASGMETEVDGMHFINALLRKNTSNP